VGKPEHLSTKLLGHRSIGAIIGPRELEIQSLSCSIAAPKGLEFARREGAHRLVATNPNGPILFAFVDPSNIEVALR